ncbi:hypothetical protein BGZ70_008739 [Mortierella alpina]|uniref:Uncharacterized protein n=1 Tax=Mortierella alpina TaxID=64518 RepID=A0A9P6M189_MORAP|nr:hypothetical protein BGZ70_008739 [Mortierella alpina]
MYWRFGHQNASVIDHLLESGNVSLEELLEQDDLIQECKAQNPRLIEYLREPAVLQQLLGYIISDDLEDRARFKSTLAVARESEAIVLEKQAQSGHGWTKRQVEAQYDNRTNDMNVALMYPFIACEVIACEVWGIFESALSNIDMLVKFWEFLDRPAPLNPVQASYFAKVIGVFLMKKTGDMLQFIKAQPDVVSKLLLHISTSSVMDLLLKIISMEESPEGRGTVQWLSEKGLMPWLVNRLDPNNDAEIHSVASQVLLDIIAISQSSHPEQPSIGTNVLIDELKSEAIVTKLVGFMLNRTAPHSTSTLINGVTIFIELIRRNNSDYDIEPLPPNAVPPREAVDLSDLLKVLAARIEDFKDLLVVPRSVPGPIETSIGLQTPLGFERLKICEMFAELLHCSNMAVLNSRPIISVSADGTVKVPTVAAEQTFHHHQSQHVKEEAEVMKSESATGEEPAEETQSKPLEEREIQTSPGQEEKSVESMQQKGVEAVGISEDTDESGKNSSSSGEEKEVKTEKKEDEKASDEKKEVDKKEEEKKDEKEPELKQASETPDSNEHEEDAAAAPLLDDQATPRASPPPGPAATLASSTIATLVSPNTLEGDVLIPVGDFLKLQFVDHRIIPTCFDLFFQFPWNNFLHTVVYDMVHQVFHRPMGDIGQPDAEGTYVPPRADQGITEGWNRRLTISIFKDGHLTKRITDAQRLCDFECSQPKGVRLGYMGHLTYIADETVKLLELYQQTSLLPTLYEYIDLEDWWNYVSKVLKETKERDAQILGGTRPNAHDPLKSGMDDGHDDEFMDDNGDEYGISNGFLGEEGSAGQEGDVGSDQFARYLSQQISNNLSEKFGSSDEDEDDEEGNWIGEYGVDNDFERRRAAAATGLDDPFGNAHAMDFDDSDDDGVDEESWNSPWPNSFGDAGVADLGSATQFSATLTDWSEDFQDGFTEFKSGEDAKDEFDFPPFSVDQSAEATQSMPADSPKEVAAGSTTDTPSDLDTQSAQADPFEDSSSSSSSSKPLNSTVPVETPATDASAPAAVSGTTAAVKEIDIEPVVLAPKVHDTPVVVGVSTETELKEPNPSSESTSTALAVDLEVVPLADVEAPKLKATVSDSQVPGTTAAEEQEPSSSAEESAEVTEISKKVEDLTLDKDAKKE